MKNIVTILLSLLVIIGGDLSAQRPYTPPAMEEGAPTPGKRVRVVAKGYENTNVYHSLYLPKNHSANGKHPIIVEYTGNYAPHLGSSGEVKDASLGYATALALDAIWMVMPYLSDDGMTSELTWWGSETHTIDYCARQLKEICMYYGGDPSSVFIIGFSRGAIAVNRIGLNDDRASDIWLGFHSHDHFDGHIAWCTDWANNCDYKSYKADAIERAKRYKGRAALIGGQHMDSVASYISINHIDTMGKLTILSVPIKQIIPENELFIHPNNASKVTHTDKWMNYDSPEANHVIKWYKEVIINKPGTYSISGTITDYEGSPVTGVIVETGFQGVDYKNACTHFVVTDSSGWYDLKGIIQGNRFINVKSKGETGKILGTETISLSKDSKVDIIVDRKK